MPCTKIELVTAINSYAAARTSNDGPLIQMAVAKLNELVDSLEYEPESSIDPE